MAKFDVLDMNGKKVSTIELSDAVFGMTPNEKVMHAAVVNFLVMAFVLFCLLKGMNKLASLAHKKEEAPAAATTKKCPYCRTEIAIDATRCPHCTSQLLDVEKP